MEFLFHPARGNEPHLDGMVRNNNEKQLYVKVMSTGPITPVNALCLMYIECRTFNFVIHSCFCTRLDPTGEIIAETVITVNVFFR